MPMASQGSSDSTLSSASFLGPFAGSPGTPSAAGEAHAAATPADLLPSPSGSDAASLSSEGGTPAPGARRCGALPAGEHMLPLQHLLMSERAQHLTSLEVKAIVYKVSWLAGRARHLSGAEGSQPCAGRPSGLPLHPHPGCSKFERRQLPRSSALRRGQRYSPQGGTRRPKPTSSLSM